MKVCSIPLCGTRVGYVIREGLKIYDRYCEKHEQIFQAKVIREAEELD